MNNIPTVDELGLNLAPLNTWTDQELWAEHYEYGRDILNATSAEQKKFLYKCRRPIVQEIERRKVEGIWRQNWRIA